jgi:hypothetical protein
MIPVMTPVILAMILAYPRLVIPAEAFTRADSMES